MFNEKRAEELRKIIEDIKNQIREKESAPEKDWIMSKGIEQRRCQLLKAESELLEFIEKQKQLDDMPIDKIKKEISEIKSIVFDYVPGSNSGNIYKNNLLGRLNFLESLLKYRLENIVNELNN